MTRGVHYLEQEIHDLIKKDGGVFRFLEAGSLDGVWYWNLERPDDEWMSPRFWTVLGYEPSEMPHSPKAWRSLIFPEDFEVANRNFEKHLADPDHPYDQIVRYRHADGSTVWLRCRGLAVRDAAGRPVRMLGAHNDVTPLKRSEDKARREAEAVRSVNDELRQFAYAMSHDMKSPANSAGMALQAIADDPDVSLTPDAAEMMEIAAISIGRLRMLVDDVLGFSRIITARQTPAPFDARAAVEEVAAAIDGEVADLGGALSCDSAPCMLIGVRWQFVVLLRNLIQNAISYRHPDRPPEIAVSLRPLETDPGGVRLRVCDNGLGVDPAFHARIFKMFQRLHAQDEIPGSGLGLTICERIAKAHRGSVSLRSRDGEGAAFTIVLRNGEVGAPLVAAAEDLG